MGIENKSSIANLCNERSKATETDVEKYLRLKNIGSIALASGGVKGIEYLGKKTSSKFAKNSFKKQTFLHQF